VKIYQIYVQQHALAEGKPLLSKPLIPPPLSPNTPSAPSPSFSITDTDDESEEDAGHVKEEESGSQSSNLRLSRHFPISWSALVCLEITGMWNE